MDPQWVGWVMGGCLAAALTLALWPRTNHHRNRQRKDRRS